MNKKLVTGTHDRVFTTSDFVDKDIGLFEVDKVYYG